MTEIVVVLAAWMLGVIVGWEGHKTKLERRERNRVWRPSNKRV
jgi:hypothetical protein